MAYEKMETISEVNVGEELLVLSAGENSVDLRKYYKNDSGEWAPTKRGIRLNKEVLTEIIGDLMRLVEEPDLEDILNTMGYEKVGE